MSRSRCARRPWPACARGQHRRASSCSARGRRCWARPTSSSRARGCAAFTSPPISRFAASRPDLAIWPALAQAEGEAGQRRATTGMSDFIERWSPNFDERSLPISMIVLHYTGMKTGAEAIDRLADPAAKVSAHYVVSEDGQITHMVPEEKRAWHAGPTPWAGGGHGNPPRAGTE